MKQGEQKARHGGVSQRGDRLRVAHFFNRLDTGGAELRTIELMEFLGSSVEPVYIVMSQKPGVLEDRVLASGGTIVRVRLGLGYALRLRRALREVSPDVIHSHLALFSGFVCFIGSLTGVSVRIAHFRSDGNNSSATIPRRFLRYVERLFVDHFCTHVIGVSPGSLTYGYRSDWRSLERAMVLPNGFAARELVPDSESNCTRPLIVHVGRPLPEKRRELAAEIILALNSVGTQAHLVFIGADGDDLQFVRKSAREGGNWNAVTFLGVVDDPIPIVAQADLLVLPSSREGLPGAVLEALSVGTPVVASRLPGVTFIAESCGGIRTVPVDASLNEWVTAVNLTLKEASSRTDIVLSFRSGPFNLRNVASNMMAIYQGAHG